MREPVEDNGKYYVPGDLYDSGSRSRPSLRPRILLITGLLAATLFFGGVLYFMMFSASRDKKRIIEIRENVEAPTPDATGMNLPFNRIAIRGTSEVIIHPARSPSMKFVEDGRQIPAEMEVSDGTLIIDTTRIPPGAEVHVYAPNLESVNLSGTSRVKIDPIKREKMEIILSGAGNCKFEGDVKNMTVRSSGSGDVTLNGKGRNLTVENNGAGDISGENFHTRSAVVSLAGSGKVYVHASQSLQAEVFGTGDVYYTGNPARINRTVTGTGSVSEKK